MKIKLNIDEGDLVYFDTFPGECYWNVGKVYNGDLEYYFKFSINENRFRKMFRNIFLVRGPNFFPA